MQLKPGKSWPTKEKEDVVMSYARDWAESMERAIAKGKTVAEVAEACRAKAKNHWHQSGGSHCFAVAMLADAWVHGDQLCEWHNALSGIKSDEVHANFIINAGEGATVDDLCNALKSFKG